VSSSSEGDRSRAQEEVVGAPEAAGEIPWRSVHELVERVLIDAEQLGARVAVALADRWGRRLAFQRQPGTVMTCSVVATAKAFTACNFNAPTHELVETISRHDQEELGRTNPGLVFAGGGFPIRAAGVLLGGIGVSGASSQEDAELALGALRSAGFDADFGAAAS
jgi:uncharacterized protein GlcG (DUF336 family)